MSKAINRFNILDISSDSEDDDVKIEESVINDDEPTNFDEDDNNTENSETFDNVKVGDLGIYDDERHFKTEYDYKTDTSTKRRMTDKEIYNDFDSNFESEDMHPSIDPATLDQRFYHPKWDDARTDIHSVSLNIIENCQATPLQRKPIDYKKFHSCVGYCCNKTDECYDCDIEGNNSEIVVKAWRRIMNLITNITDNTPVEYLSLYHACEMTEFFKQNEGQRTEKFKTHGIITNECGFIANLHTWLSFNTGMKTFNKRTKNEENLKLFIGTYDTYVTGHDLDMNDDEIEDINNCEMAPLRRDLYVLKLHKPSERVNRMIAETEKKIRIVYANYLTLLAPRIKFFTTFDQARYYIKRHHCSVALNKELEMERHGKILASLYN